MKFSRYDYTPTLEWQITNDSPYGPQDGDETEGIPLHPPPQNERAHIRCAVCRLVVLVFSIWMVRGAAAYEPLHNTETAVVLAKVALQAVVTREMEQCQRTGALADRSVDAQIPSSIRRWLVSCQPWRNAAAREGRMDIQIDTQRVELAGEQARVIARITTTTNVGLATAYQQRFFYRHTAAGWVRTIPDSTTWGAPRVIETHFFQLHFYEQDAQAVQVVASEIDALYIELRRDLGLNLPLVTSDVNAKIKIEIWPAVQPCFALRYPIQASERLVAPSPALLPLPEHSGVDAMLYGFLVSLLSRRVLDEALQQHSIHPVWRPVVGQLRVYPWFDRAVEKWCLEPDDSLQRAFVGNWLLSLALDASDGNTATGSTGSSTSDPDLFRQRVARAAVDHTVKMHGRAHLGRWLSGMETHTSWDTLVPAVFDVSLEEFEEDWYTYLQQR